MKRILILVILASLMGCDSAVEQTWPVVPDGLKDCQIYKLKNGGGAVLRVVRCPNSSTSTTYPVGKHQETSVVIDQ